MTEIKIPTITVGGNKLELKLDILAMRRLRRYENPIDITKVLDKSDPKGGLVNQMAADPSIAVDIAFEATEHEPKRPADTTEFARGLGGDNLDAVIDAALEAVILFTPDRKVRAALQAVKVKADAASDAITDAMMTAIEDGTLDKEMDIAIQEIRKEAGLSAGEAFKATQPGEKSKPGSSSNAPSSASSTSTSKTGSKASVSATSSK